MKDDPELAAEFATALRATLAAGIHLISLDPFPPGPPKLESYIVGYDNPVAIEPLAYGQRLPDAQLFLSPELTVPVPLEAAYMRAWRGSPAWYRETLGTGGEA